MDQLTSHQRAQDIFATVLANVKPDQLDAQSPCSEWTAQGVIDHVIGGNQWVQDRGGREPVALPDGLAESLAASAAGAQATFAGPDGLTKPYELPFGTLPGNLFIGLRTGDVITHAWDLAVATGQSTDLDPDASADALAFAKSMIVPDFRGPGRPFGPEQPCPPGATPADQLAAFLGRMVPA